MERDVREAAGELIGGSTRREFFQQLGIAGAGLVGAMAVPGMLGWGARKAYALAGSEVRLGVAQPLTGVYATWAHKHAVAMEMLTEKVNGSGGVAGIPVKFLWEDTGSTPTGAANAVRKLASEHNVLAIAGPLASTECEVAFPVGNRIGIVMCAQASSKPGVSAANRPYAFRNTMDEGKLAKACLPVFAKEMKVSKVAVVHDAKDAVSRSLGTMVLPTVAKAVGLQIVNPDKYVTYTTSDFDFKAQVTRMKQMEFDGILFGGLQADCVAFAKELRRQGMKQPITGGSPLIHPDLPKAEGGVTDNTYAPCTFWSDMPGAEVEAFVKEFERRAAGKATLKTKSPDMYDVNMYDIGQLFIQIIKTSGVTNKPEDLKADRTKIMEAMTKTTDFPGLAGKFGFDKDGDGVKPIYTVKAQGGKWVKAG